MARLVHTNYPADNCQECGSSFIPIRHDQLFCTVKRPKCKDVSHARELKRAWTIYRELYHHVCTSGSEERGASLSALMRQARQWRDEDRSKGLPPPPLSERMKIERVNKLYEERLVAARTKLAAKRAIA